MGRLSEGRGVWQLLLTGPGLQGPPPSKSPGGTVPRTLPSGPWFPHVPPEVARADTDRWGGGGSPTVETFIDRSGPGWASSLRETARGGRPAERAVRVAVPWLGNHGWGRLASRAGSVLQRQPVEVVLLQRGRGRKRNGENVSQDPSHQPSLALPGGSGDLGQTIRSGSPWLGTP